MLINPIKLRLSAFVSTLKNWYLAHWRGSAMASPGGKLSSKARLMRNGDIFWYATQANKNIQSFELYLFYDLYS